MINRDSNNPSLWQSTVDEWQPKNAPEANVIYDVIIVGGGITGVSTALLLQEAGKKCLLLEARNLGYGTTGGTTAHLNTLLDTPYLTIQKKFNKDVAQKTAAATAAAIDLIRNNIRTYDIDCGFEETEAFLFAQNDKQDKELDEIMKANEEVGLSATYSNDIPVPIPFSKAIRVAGQAKFHPLKYLHGIANAFEAAGGTIVQDCRVTNLKQQEPLVIETTAGIFKSIDIIYATHIPPGVNLLHLRCVPYRSYAMAVILEDGQYPEGLSYDMLDPYHYYRSQKVDGQHYLIAGGKDHKTGQEENTEKFFIALEATIREHFVVKEIVYKWSSQYFEPADGLPYIGHLPGHPEHVYTATGFGGNGMVYSSIAAMIFKTILLNEEEPSIDPALFDPNRLKPVAGFTNFITHNADAVKNFIGRLFSGEQIDQLRQLRPGEGRIVEYEKKKIGLYRDEDGNLFGVDPVCTHLKCEVKWNDAERSWDCPCHGARYNFDGQVVTGPADHSLKTFDLSDETEKKKLSRDK